jgi:O-antigen/teichoic acid export membrane protein
MDAEDVHVGEPASPSADKRLSPGGAPTSGAAVLAGGAWNVASRLVPQFYLVAVSIAAARFLGPDQFGRQSFIAFAAISVTVLCTAGFPLALTRYVGDAIGRHEEGKARQLSTLGWKVQGAGAAVAMAILVGAALSGAEPRAAWLFASASAAAVVVNKVPLSLLAGFQRWRSVTLPGLVIGLVASAATIVVLALGGRITAMFAVEAGAATTTLVVTIALARAVTRTLPEHGPLERSQRARVLGYAALSSVGVVITFVVWRRSEIFVLERLSTDAQIGFYSIAFSAASALTLAFQGLTATLFPATATLHAAGETERIRHGYGRAARLIIVTVLPITAGALALGPPLLGLAYGGGFGDAVLPLVLLLAFLPLVAVSGLATGYLGAVGRLRPTVVAGVVAALLDIGLDFALIPSHGALGAAIANSAAQSTVAVAAVVYAWRMVGGVRWDPAMVLRVAAASGGGGLAAWAVVSAAGGISGVVLGLVSGLILFSLLATSLSILSRDDASWLDDLIGGLLGGRVGRLLRVWSRPSVEPEAL